MSDVTVWLAGSDDIPALAALIGGFRDHLGAQTPTDADLRTQLPLAQRQPDLEFALASLGGEPIGYAQLRFWLSVWACGAEAQLDDLFVASSARGRGAGRALLRFALGRAATRRARRLGLNTNEQNLAAQTLYRSEGLAPQSHARFPGGREIFWAKAL